MQLAYTIHVGKLFSYMAFSCCTDEYAHTVTYNVSTCSISNNCVCDSSSELQCLGSPYVQHMCTVIMRTSMQHANAMLKKS